jgi:hypothetical protein
MLLQHWTEKEISSQLHDPEYFFDQVVNPRMAYLRRQGEDAPHFRTQRTPLGALRVLLHPL